MDAMIVIGCLLCIAVPFVALLSCRYSFDNGNPKRVDLAWLSSWKVLGVVAVAAAIGSFLTEVFVHEIPVAEALRWAFVANLTVVSAWSDFKDRLISNKQVLWALALGLLAVFAQIAFDSDDLTYYAIDAAGGFVVGGVVFLLSRIVSRGGVGFGDVKLFAAIGLLVGLRGVISIVFYTAFAAFVVSIVLLVTRKKSLADSLPLGPFALFGVVVAVSFGV